MRLLLGGMDPDQHFKLRRLEEDRIQPITVPYSQEVLDSFLGIDPDDAWLPLSIGLLNRLYTLWMSKTSGAFMMARTTRDEYLYQVIRQSFLNVFQSREDNESTQKLIKARLPRNLPTSGKLASFTQYDQARYDDKFESIQNALVSDALKFNISPDVRSVDDALKSFDIHIDKQRLAHLQQELANTSDTAETEERRRHLKRLIQSLQRELATGEQFRLASAIEIVARLRSIWELLYPDTRSLQRYHGDEPTYQIYRNVLMAHLDDDNYADLHATANELVPRLLPLSEELIPSNTLFAEMPGRFERLRNEIVARAAQLHESVTIDYGNHPELDEELEEEHSEWLNLKKTVGRVRTQPPIDSRSEVPAVIRRGRKAIEVEYEVAARVWWEMFEESKDRQPTQPEFTERLTALGFPMRPRTLRNRIAEWQRDGKTWPPPENYSSAA